MHNHVLPFPHHRRIEQQQVSLEDVDDALIEALKDSKERCTGKPMYYVKLLY